MKRRFMFGMIMAVATMMAGCAGNSISKQASQEVSTMQTQEITEGTSVEDVTSGSTSPEKSTIAPVENGLWTDGVNEFYVEYDTDLCTCHIREIMKASDDFIIPDEINGYAVTFVNFGEETIQRLTNVTSITIPNSMPEHEFHSYNSLYFLPNVTEYRVKENSPYCVIDGVLYTADRSTLLRCPIKKTGELIVPAETHHLAMEAFYSCENLTSIRFCDNIVADGYWVFVGCSGLTELVLPNWPGAIMVLNGMENIEEIVIANCEYVPFSLAYFSGCDALTTLRFCGTIGSVDVESWGTTGIKDIYCNNSSKDQEMFQPLVDMGIRIHYQLEEMDFAQDYQALENASIEDGIKFVQKYLYPAFTVPKDMKDRIDHMVISINLPEDGSPITSD